MDAPWRWSNVPVPEPHAAGLLVGVGLHVLVPWSLLPWPWLGLAVGLTLVLAGLGLAAWAVAAAGDVDLNVPNRMVTGGPYAYSRNPMYVAWTLLYVGVAAAITVWLLLLLPVVLLFTHIVVVREEREMERRFGDEYRRYERRVRRYL